MHPFEQQREEIGEVEATVAARGRARELGIDLSEVDGTGSGGRVTRDDVEAHAVAEANGVGDDSDPTGEQGGDLGDEAPQEFHPGGILPEPDGSGSGFRSIGREAVVKARVGSGVVTFFCLTNPNFNISSPKLPCRTIYFTDGAYETDDPEEISVLRACQFVEEVSNG